MRGFTCFALTIAVVLASATTLAAQTAPVADGSILSGEYAVERLQGGIRCAFALSADGKTLYAAVDAGTAGWVALGLGTKKMDRAHMVFAYVKDGTAAFSEERGSGWKHTPTDPLVLTKAAAESAGRTVLEFSIPAERFVKGKTRDVICAVGSRDEIVSRHTGRFSLTVKFP